mmetsp:Transcript_10154/g.18788  ORF Transcript_10154/g.18788 Transcript_10154/m.18788 type:complete len:115 (-) Transcript_10154:85-429(-)
MQENVFAIDNGKNCVKVATGLQKIIHKESLNNGGRVGKTGSLNNNRIERILPFKNFLHSPNKIATNSTAHATVVHLKNFFLALKNETFINTNLTEFIFNNGDFLPVLSSKNVVH